MKGIIKRTKENYQLKKVNKLFKQKKYRKGIQILEQLSDNDCSIASFSLGRIYYQGKIKHQNYEKSFKYFKRASEEISSAMYNLGVLYHKGQGIEKNISLAFYYFQKAAILGNFDAKTNVIHAQELNKVFNGLSNDVGLYNDKIQ